MNKEKLFTGIGLGLIIAIIISYGITIMFGNKAITDFIVLYGTILILATAAFFIGRSIYKEVTK